MQVGGEPGGGVAGQVVVVVRVVGDAAAQPRRQALPGVPFPTGRQPRGQPRQVPAGGQRLRADAVRDPDPARGGQRLADGSLAPAPEVRREDREVVGGGRGDGSRGQHGGHGVVHVQPAAPRRQGGPQELLAPVRVRADVGRQVHLVGLRLPGHRAHLLDQVAGADDQPPAPVPQPRVQVPQTVGEEGEPVGRGESGRVHGPVADEQRHHGIGAVQGRTQRRMVVQPQIAGEQDDRRGHGAPRRGCRAGDGTGPAAPGAGTR